MSKKVSEQNSVLKVWLRDDGWIRLGAAKKYNEVLKLADSIPGLICYKVEIVWDIYCDNARYTDTGFFVTYEDITAVEDPEHLWEALEEAMYELSEIRELVDMEWEVGGRKYGA